MASLSGKTVFVAGGAGNIGGSIVRGCLKAGATVVTASRDPARFERLKNFCGKAGFADSEKLITIQGDLGEEAGAMKLRDDVLAKTNGELDAVIASLGGGMTPHVLTDLPVATWNTVLKNNLTSHFLAAKAFLPVLTEHGSGAYLLLSGHGGETAWPENGPVSVAALGVIGLGRNLAAENKRSGVRVKPMVLITSPDLWKKLEGTPGAYQGDDVGDFLAWLASEESAKETAEVIRYVTDWTKANAMMRA